MSDRVKLTLASLTVLMLPFGLGFSLKVDRSTKWGNPFKVEYKGTTLGLAVQSFKNVLDEFGEYQISSRTKVTIDDIKRE